MFPTALLQKVTAQILLVTALHDDYLGARFRVVHARGHRDVPPVDCVLSCGIRFNLIHFVWVVTDDPVATLARDRASDGSREPVPRAVVIEAALGVLVAGEREDMAPARLVPGRLYQAAAFHGVAN